MRDSGLIFESNVERPIGQPKKRLKDKLDAYEEDWPVLANDRDVWKVERKAFGQQ